MRETDLYEPVKRTLEQQGYTVRGEVLDCDLVAVKEGEEPLIVELKQHFNVTLLLQASERLKISGNVYVAVPRKTGAKRARTRKRWLACRGLCQRLGIGLLTVSEGGQVEVWCAPGEALPKRQPRKQAQLLREFAGRSGDYQRGGSVGRPLVTAYRERALHCAAVLAAMGEALAPRELRRYTGHDDVAAILQRNYYGWFCRVQRGYYALTPAGEAALQQYAHVLHGWARPL